MIGMYRQKGLFGSQLKEEKFEFMQKSETKMNQTEWWGSIPDQAMRSRSLPLKILLVDDDATFGKIMLRSAKLRGVDLTFCVALDEVAQYNHEKFDLALIDFNLGSVTGIEFAEYLTRYAFGALDTIIISHSPQTVSHLWPLNARRFLHKKMGHQMIWDSIFQAYRTNQLRRAEKDAV